MMEMQSDMEEMSERDGDGKRLSTLRQVRYTGEFGRTIASYFSH